MKRILLLILGYYLIVQAAIGGLSICSNPEHAAILLPLACLSGWGGYKLIHMARTITKVVQEEPSSSDPLS